MPFVINYFFASKSYRGLTVPQDTCHYPSLPTQRLMSHPFPALTEYRHFRQYELFQTHQPPCSSSLLLITLPSRLRSHQQGLNHVARERTRDNDTQKTVRQEGLRSTGCRVCRRVLDVLLSTAKLDILVSSSAEETTEDLLVRRKDRGVDLVCDIDGGGGSHEICRRRCVWRSGR